MILFLQNRMNTKITPALLALLLVGAAPVDGQAVSADVVRRKHPVRARIFAHAFDERNLVCAGATINLGQSPDYVALGFYGSETTGGTDADGKALPVVCARNAATPSIGAKRIFNNNQLCRNSC